VKIGTGTRRQVPVAVVLVAVSLLAVLTHRHGIGWGDDFALYARQARAIFDGDVARVITDNRFDVDNAARPAFSPYVYPWGWPLLLSPFVRLWGLDWGRLSLVSVACFAAFLGFFHAVLCRRMNRWAALAVVAAVGTTLAYLQHTADVLSELPFMFAAAVTLWWIDRCRRGGGALIDASRNELIVLGLLAMFVFNVRREGLAMLPALASTQLVECLREHRWPWRRLLTPHAAFAAGAMVFQLVLPSALAPRYDGAGLGQTWRKLRDSYRTSFVDQLGFPRLATAWLVVVLLLVAAGVVVRLWRHAADDAAVVVFPALALVIVGMIPANSTRYTMAITPFAVYFAAQALAAVPRAGWWIAAVAMAALAVVHLTDVVPEIRATHRFNAAGFVLDGPETAESRRLWSAIRTHTHQDDVVAFFKVRALTLYTDRRGVQSSELPVIVERANYFVMARHPNAAAGQIAVTDDEAASMGWTTVWSDDTWVLWKIGENGRS